MKPTDYLDVITRITPDGVYFGDEKVPGLVDEEGITLRPGGADGFNRLTVTFIVGRVEAEDPTSVRVRGSGSL